MKDLPDDTLLREMSIPGTHDTCSKDTVAPDGFGFFKAAITQDDSIEDQLKKGIRCFDIRVDLEGSYDQVWFYHGPVRMVGYFKKTVHDVCKEFLSKENHPGETIIMFIKHEFDEDTHKFRASNKDRLREFLQKTVENSTTYIDGRKKDLSRLTLGEVRSKIVLIDRSDLTHIGFKYNTRFKNSAGKEQEVFYIQDDYKYPHVDEGVQKKISNFITNSGRFNDPNIDEYQRWPLTFISFTDDDLSGDDPFTPRQAAEKMNPAFYRYLINDFKGNRVGTVLMDFPDKHARTRLVSKIISYNWKHPYLIEIKTADEKDAGTDSNISLILHGQKGEYTVDPKFGIGHDAYEQNAIDSSLVHTPFDLGSINAVTVDFDKGGRKSGWCLDYITVTNVADAANGAKPQLFDFNHQWFYNDGTKKVTASKEPQDKLRYEMRIKTADKKDAGTDANITVQLNGMKGSYTFDPKKKGIPGDGFEQNQTDYLSFLADKDIGQIYNITVWFDAHGKKSGWCLEYIEISTPYNTDGGWTRFPFNPSDGGQWFYSANDKKIAYPAGPNPLGNPHQHKRMPRENIERFGEPGDMPLSFATGVNNKNALAVWRYSNSLWFVQNGIKRPFGKKGDIPVRFDKDGDGKSDVCIYRPSNGYWYAVGSDGIMESTLWGKPGDIPVTFDFEGDGKSDCCVFRPSNGYWFVKGLDGAVKANNLSWGEANDIPVSFDYDGDGKSEYCVFRPSNGNWYFLTKDRKQFTTVNWGRDGDIPVPFVNNNDGKSSCCVWRPSNGTWYVLNGPTVELGTSGDIPVPMDIDGDGITDFCIWCPVTGNWHTILNKGL
ncbi:MAG: phosphatidylinositol-specific phospholipase C domain-containing protein [Candidatus Rifleibacteriota bacterium]